MSDPDPAVFIVGDPRKVVNAAGNDAGCRRRGPSLLFVEVNGDNFLDVITRHRIHSDIEVDHGLR
jgi:hypothetical protein